MAAAMRRADPAAGGRSTNFENRVVFVIAWMNVRFNYWPDLLRAATCEGRAMTNFDRPQVGDTFVLVTEGPTGAAEHLLVKVRDGERHVMVLLASRPLSGDGGGVNLEGLHHAFDLDRWMHLHPQVLEGVTCAADPPES
jgi:hypothetical protein